MTTTSGGRSSEESLRRATSQSTQTPKPQQQTSKRPAGPVEPAGRQAPPAQGTVVPSGGTPFVPRQRRLRLTVQRIDPWTVLRLSFLLSVAIAVVMVVALLLLWSMLASGGVFDSVDTTLQSILGDGAVTVT